MIDSKQPQQRINQAAAMGEAEQQWEKLSSSVLGPEAVWELERQAPVTARKSPEH